MADIRVKKKIKNQTSRSSKTSNTSNKIVESDAFQATIVKMWCFQLKEVNLVIKNGDLHNLFDGNNSMGQNQTRKGSLFVWKLCGDQNKIMGFGEFQMLFLLLLLLELFL